MRISPGTAAEAGTLHAVARAKQGDGHAVRYLYSRYAGKVRLYAGSILRDADAVDDVVQTTFLKLLTGIDRYEPQDAPFEAWLLRVARNAAFDELRRRRTRETLALLDGDGAAGPDAPADLETALDGLPAVWREVLVLRHVVGLSTEEVAERLRLAPKAVSVLQARACEQLRGTLRAWRSGQAAADGPARGRADRLGRPLVEELG